MDADVFEVTPVAALSVTTTLFLELSAALDKSGVISAAALGRNILAAANEVDTEDHARSIAATLRSVGQSLIDQFDQRDS
jgi:hypothetical protein